MAVATCAENEMQQLIERCLFHAVRNRFENADSKILMLCLQKMMIKG